VLSSLELNHLWIDNRNIERRGVEWGGALQIRFTGQHLVTAMHKTFVTLAALLSMTAAALPATGQTQDAAQKPPTTFRSGLDLIAVDVQVIDREGSPVAGLGPDKFEVTINGRRRRVVSADLVESRSALTLTPAERAAASGGSAIPMLPRVVMIAIDCLSFDASASRHVLAATRDFIDRLPATDEVGLFAYPYGPKLNPTTDHAAISRELLNVIGQRDIPSHQFHLRPSEIVDLTAATVAARMQEVSLLETVARRECGTPVEETCRQRLMLEILGTALYYEGQGNASLGMLRSLIEELNSISGRKTLVLISAGMMASDVPGGRPDINELGMQVGKEAARANTSIYTLYLDTSTIDRFSAEARSADKNLQSEARDSEVLGRWLDQFSGAAGGAMFKIQVGSGELAFDRIYKEISAYYLLGVEPDASDRDGRTHEVKVRTTLKSATIRGRRWVTIPKRDANASEGSESAPTEKIAAEAAKPTAPPKPRVAASVQALADLYGQDVASFQRGLVQTQDLAALIRDFRASDNPWPDAPKRTAVFALELAVAALRSDNRYARDEGGRLLAEYNARVRAPEAADAFECSWLWTEVAALEGLFMADSAMLFVPHAVERCPGEARLHLANAIISEQQWLRGSTGATEEADIFKRYEQAIKVQETGAEARMRAAWFLSRTGKLEQALALVGPPLQPDTDRYLHYLTDLVRGQILRAMNRPDDAEKAFEAALTTWPGAQSARVALMTLQLSRGNRQEAATLADAAQTAPSEQFDPWWTYWLGDYRVYPAILAKLREMVR
jgi:VWFA-related protein